MIFHQNASYPVLEQYSLNWSVSEKTPKYMYETTQFMPPNGFRQLHGTKHATERMPKKTAIKYATDLS